MQAVFVVRQLEVQKALETARKLQDEELKREELERLERQR